MLQEIKQEGFMWLLQQSNCGGFLNPGTLKLLSKQDTSAFSHSLLQQSPYSPGYPAFLLQRLTLTARSSGWSCEADRGQVSLLSCLQNHSLIVWKKQKWNFTGSEVQSLIPHLCVTHMDVWSPFLTHMCLGLCWKDPMSLIQRTLRVGGRNNEVLQSCSRS